MLNNLSIMNNYECPVCGHIAGNERDLSDHYSLKPGDTDHKEYSLSPQDKEILDEYQISRSG